MSTLHLADILNSSLGHYRQHHIMSYQQQRVCQHLQSCRTGQLGYQTWQCDNCGESQQIGCSCRDRHCPRCQGIYQMKYGINFQNQIDICSINDGTCVLSIIQSEVIDDTNIELLQDKLNHYLCYILDGQLEEEEPNKYALPKRIELIIGHVPTDTLTGFIEQLTPILEAENIKFVLKSE
ncbi:transposase zinc-binding domain-containing protein [Pseudoalteromonas peptidolytica]